MTGFHGSLNVHYHSTADGKYVRLVTYSADGGGYRSIGQVRVNAEYFREPQNMHEFARLLLAALYGLDYDL